MWVGEAELVGVEIQEQVRAWSSESISILWSEGWAGRRLGFGPPPTPLQHGAHNGNTPSLTLGAQMA